MLAAQCRDFQTGKGAHPVWYPATWTAPARIWAGKFWRTPAIYTSLAFPLRMVLAVFLCDRENRQQHQSPATPTIWMTLQLQQEGSRMRYPVSMLLAFLFVSWVIGADPEGKAGGPNGKAPLLDNLGQHHHAVSTENKEAQ